MKQSILLLLAICLLLTGCGGPAVPETTAPATTAPTEATTVPTTIPTEAPTEAPTEPPLPTNPLTGEVLDMPSDMRIFAAVINNVQPAMPMYGVSKADLFFEMFVNDYCTRGLALFSDISQVSAVGSIRSLRYNFTDLSRMYDAVVLHASGSKQVLADLKASGVPAISVENEAGDYYFRDQDRLNAGYAWEHCLFVKGEETVKFAEQKGIRVTRDADASYGLHFTEEPLTAGSDAREINLRFLHDGHSKESIFLYDEELGSYRFRQFGRDMYDDREDQPICFENVLILFCQVYNEGVYHVAQLEGGGEGFLARDGKMIPIRWQQENAEEPFTFTNADGTPLALGAGSSYIALAPTGSDVSCK